MSDAVRDLIERHFPADQVDNAMRVVEVESSFRPDAVNNTAYPDRPGYRPPGEGHLPEYSVGLFQINVRAHPALAAAYNLRDPAQNVAAAASIYNRQGWSPWSAARVPGVIQEPGGGAGANGPAEPSPAWPYPAPTRPGPGAGGIALNVPGLAETLAGMRETMARVGGLMRTAEWLQASAAPLIMRAMLVIIGVIIFLMGLMFLLRSL